MEDIFKNQCKDYNEILLENVVVYKRLLEFIEDKISNDSFPLTIETVSRFDDIFEDIVSTNTNIKLLYRLLEKNLPIHMSNREQERNERKQYIHKNKLLPTLLFLSMNS
jgi:hypothetical protein